MSMGRKGRTDRVLPPYRSPMIELTEPKLMSRILYTNPVCILTTCVPNPLPPASGEGDAAPPPSSAGERNAMIVSWLVGFPPFFTSHTPHDSNLPYIFLAVSPFFAFSMHPTR